MEKISLTLAQSIKEIEFINNNLQKPVLWVPVNLETLLYLKQKNMNYINPSEFLDNNFHKESLDESEKVKNIVIKSLQIDDLYKKRYLGIIRKYFFSIFYVLKLVKAIDNKYKIGEIIVSGWSQYDFVKNKNNYFLSKIILGLFNNQKKITFITRLKNNFHSVDLKYKLPKINYKNFIIISNLGYNFKRLVFTNFFSKNKILLINFSKISIFKQLLFKILGVNFINISRLKIDKGNIKNQILNFPKINYSYQNYDFSNLFEHRGNQIQTEIEEIKKIKKVFEGLFSKNKPNKIFLNMTRGINSFLIQYAKKNKISCYLIPHGTISHSESNYGKIYNNIISSELISKDCVNCSQTKIAEEFFNKRNGFEVLKTGNLIFGEANKAKSKKNILYAVTNRDFTNMLPYGIESFSEYYSNLKFLDDLSDKKKLKIIVKLHPGISNLKDSLQIEFKNLKFSNEKLEKLLSDTFVTISFSSTAIEDALVSKQPVILFDQWKRYRHCKSELNPLKGNAAIYYINDANNLLLTIETIKNLNNKIDYKKYLFKGNISKNFKKIVN